MIKEQIYLGKLDPQSRYAEITVDVLYNQEKNPIRSLKAFIDTGATRTHINEAAIAQYISLDAMEEIETGSAMGTSKTKNIPNIYIRLNPLMSEKHFIPLDSVGTVKLYNGFDVIIGNDILHMCEFIYNGLSQTYILKFLYQN